MLKMKERNLRCWPDSNGAIVRLPALEDLLADRAPLLLAGRISVYDFY
jgi:hypothetical protein